MVDYKLTSLFLETNNNIELSVDEICRITQLTEDVVKQQLFQLMKIQEVRELNIILETSNGHYIFQKDFKRKWLDIIFNCCEKEQVYSDFERKSIIYLIIFSESIDLSVFYFQDFLHVSKNTILSDIKKLREELEMDAVDVVYSRKKGYLLKGSENDIRRLAYSYVDQLLISRSGELILYKFLNHYEKDYYTILKNCFLKIKEDYALQFVPSKTEFTIYYLCFLMIRAKKYPIKISSEDKEFLKSIDIYQASVHFIEYFPELKNMEEEILYVLLIFLSITQGKPTEEAFEFLMRCSYEIIKETERMSAIEFTNYRQILDNVYAHLVPAYFRIKYKFPLNNILIEDIKSQYAEIFTITKLTLGPLEKLTGEKIPESEIGYFTILFGGAILNQKESALNKKYRGLIICPSGVSSSLIMKSELEKLFPLIHFESTSALYRLDDIEINNFDIVFSNVPLKVVKKVYLVKPVMSQSEKINIIQKVQNELLTPGILYPTAQEIIDMIIPYVELKKGITKAELNEVVSKKLDKKINTREDNRPMLSELITKETIQIVDKKMSWEEAIAISAQPLLQSGKIKETYIDAMIQKVNDYGAFINIGKNIALPHARPEDGVNEIGMSLLKVKEPILLLNDENHPITLFICLAASDNETHLKALASLTKILSDKESFNQLLEADTTEDILKIINRGE